MSEKKIESQYESGKNKTSPLLKTKHVYDKNNDNKSDESADLLKEKPMGIFNIKSNCYINVVLQCLANIPQFVYVLYNYVKGKHGESFSITDDEIDEQFTNKNNIINNFLCQKVTPSFLNIMYNVKGEQLIISFTSKLFQLSKMHTEKKNLNLRNFLQLLSADFFPNLKFSKHEDCQEFLIRFFEIVNDLIKVVNGYVDEKNDSEFAINKDQSIIKDIFGGILEETITCGKCDYLNKIYQPFDILTINIIPQLSGSDLSMTMQHSFKKELIRGTICEKCKSSPIYKETVFFKQPQVLILHIARLVAQDVKLLTPIRFPFEQFSLEKMLMRMENATAEAITTMKKWHRSVYQAYQSSLDNKGFIEPPKKYWLTGVIEHIGIDGYGGHYICYNKRTHSNGMKRWYLFDDSEVCCVTPNTVREAEPYCLFYSSY